jgi:6-phosphogluconolactonase (cycloisomerase 2 family)
MQRLLLTAVLGVTMTVMSASAAFADRSRHEDHDRGDRAVGAVYAMTNAPDGNEVVIFDRDEDGTLTQAGAVATGGLGSGGGFDPLASQDSLVLTSDYRWLLAVNGGSHEMSVFRVKPDGLKLVDRVSSGGFFPVSVTVYHDLVYVLNAGTSPNITGFSINHRGRLTPLADSTRSLGVGAFSQVGFDPRGQTLVVTDRADSEILVYGVDGDGLPSASPVTSTSNGETPFAFIFDRRGHLLVVEVGPNAVSSYDIQADNTLQVISGSVPNGQQAACWIAGTRRGDVFTTNPASGTVSAYRARRDGRVALRDGAAGSGTTPLDLAITSSGRFLYALDPNGGGIDAFQITRDGGLNDLGAVDGGLSVFAQGIAVR